MPAATTMYQPSAPSLSGASGKPLPLRSAATKNSVGTTLTMSTPLARSAGARSAAAIRSVAGSSAVPSLTHGGGSSSGSSAAGTDHVDLISLMGDRLTKVADPTPMDRTLAKQAQASGELNAKNREIEELRAMLARRTKTAKKNFADGMRAAKDVKKDLDWTQNQISALNIRAAERHPEAFRAANARLSSRVRAE